MDNVDVNSLTPEYIESLIIKKDFQLYNSVDEDGKIVAVLTTCILTVKNGTLVFGNTTCQLAPLYNQEMEETVSYDNAIDSLLSFEFYLLKEREYIKSLQVKQASVKATLPVKEGFGRSF